MPTRLNKGESLTDASDGQEAPYFEGALGVALSNTNGAVVKSDYYVWNWGLNDKGQLGNGARRLTLYPLTRSLPNLFRWAIKPPRLWS